MYRGKRERPNVGVKNSAQVQGEKNSAGGANKPATDQV
jgi:hypothetical protein